MILVNCFTEGEMRDKQMQSMGYQEMWKNLFYEKKHEYLDLAAFG